MATKQHSGAVKVKGKDDGCCGMTFLKYLLFIFNFIFWISGGVLIGIAVWTIIDRHSFVSLLNSGFYVAVTYILLATGAAIIVIGFIGCVGAWRESRGCLLVYAGLLLLVFLAEAIAGIVAYMYESIIHEELLRSLNTTMLQNYKIDMDKTEAIDDLQRTFECCGAKSYADWQGCKWLLMNQNITNKTPDSCCKTETYRCGVRNHPSNIYYDGCVSMLENYLRENLVILGSIGLGICCLQIFGIVFACCLAKKIKEWEERQKSYAW